jgi:hypothetical protein
MATDAEPKNDINIFPLILIFVNIATAAIDKGIDINGTSYSSP